MHGNQILCYTSLLLTIMIIYSYGRIIDEDSEDISLENDKTNSLSKLLDGLISKRGCSVGSCSSDSDCCSGSCRRRYSFNSFRTLGYCDRRMYFAHSWRTHDRYGK
ncbi:hypothetical protein I4U23_022691 [Adineta vaga]|nr:hypothetical protein I4U23_022691 [Adineta vaga]